MSKRYTYHIELAERGFFYATVRDSNGETIFEISTDKVTKGYNFQEMIQDGWIKHSGDIKGLKDYLVHIGELEASDVLVKATSQD